MQKASTSSVILIMSKINMPQNWNFLCVDTFNTQAVLQMYTVYIQIYPGIIYVTLQNAQPGLSDHLS